MAPKAKARKVTEGVAYIKATFNNTKVLITDMPGNALVAESSGSNGYKGSRKGTPYAAQVAATSVGKKAMEKHHMKRIGIKVDGHGAGRESAIRGLRSAGLEVVRLEDVTRLPHNGCRPRKKRRV
jgi:small subunit ribosomal protein S11